MRENKGIGGTLPSPKTGLIEDYINVWIAKTSTLNFIDDCKEDNEPYEHLFERLKKPIKHYEIYVREKYPEWADDILEKSDKKAIKKIDELADQYNKELELGHYGRGTFNKYWNSAEFIIRGKNLK